MYIFLEQLDVLWKKFWAKSEKKSLALDFNSKQISDSE